ncbi:MAG: ABC transporter ATP-binding protein/permease [Cytophagales bacterium]|nr:ABC transporter ATP-binding protein/permease [Cytophagales bacterium]MDW8384857.1 ABC transporter ATP-binding protein [Flammeovirgaceae bacterium]
MIRELASLNRYLWRYKKYLFWGVFFTAISNIFAVVPAQLVRNSFNFIIQTLQQHPPTQKLSQQLLEYGLLIVGMAIMRGIFLFFMRQTIIVMSRKIEYDLKNDIYQHYQTLPMSFYRCNNTGDLMARISEDVSQVRQYLGPGIMYGFNMIISSIIIVTYMFIVDATLALWALLPLPVLSIGIYWVNSSISKRSDEIQQNISALSTFVQEAFSGIRVIKAFAREKDSFHSFQKISNLYKQKAIALVKVESFFFPVILSMIGISIVLVVYIGGLQIIAGKLTAGHIAEFIIYINLLTWPVTSIGWVTSVVQRAAVSQKRINEFLKTKTTIVSTRNLKKILQGNIAFEDVSFTYPDSGIQAIKHLSFSIQAGEKIAIIGATGSGKSTIAHLLCRMYDTTQGRILIDGIPIQDYEISFLRSQIGYVPQDVFLFSDTIYKNITFGMDDTDYQKVEKFARDAGVYDNIMDFPEKFETVIGERGITLSGGQKQRISIARALIREPKILILDDSLSAVDTKTENQILTALQENMKGKTAIIISHRISSAKLADRIIVLEGGQIAQIGTHNELIATEGIYKELWEKQQLHLMTAL